MSLTVTKTGDWSGTMGNKRYASVTLDFDSSYPTGGESLTAAELGLRSIDFIHIRPKGGVIFEYDYTNSKVLAYVPGVTVSAAGSATLDDYAMSGVAATTAVSIGLDNAAGAGTHRFGVLKEAANATDLSTITGVRVFALGV